MKTECLLISICLLASARLAAAEPLSILNIPGSGTDPDAIDCDSLPREKGGHTVNHPDAFSPDDKHGEKLGTHGRFVKRPT